MMDSEANSSHAAAAAAAAVHEPQQQLDEKQEAEGTVDDDEESSRREKTASRTMLERAQETLSKFRPVETAGAGTNGAVVRCNVDFRDLQQAMEEHAPESAASHPAVEDPKEEVEVAVKVVNFFWDEHSKQYLKMENRALSHLPEFHPNIVNILFHFESVIPVSWHQFFPDVMAQWAAYDENYTTTFFVMEYFPATLEEIQESMAVPMTPKLVFSIAESLLEGARYLEENHIVHLDLTASNVLAGANQRFSIGDLGINFICQDSSLRCTIEDLDSMALNTSVTAPEVLKLYEQRAKRKNSSLRVEVDLSKHTVWCVGLILYKCCTGIEPLPTPKTDWFFNYDIDCVPKCHSKWNHCSDTEDEVLLEFGKLVHGMLHCNPSQRSSTKEALTRLRELRRRMFSPDSHCGGKTWNLIQTDNALKQMVTNIDSLISDSMEQAGEDPHATILLCDGILFRCEKLEAPVNRLLPEYRTLREILVPLRRRKYAASLRSQDLLTTNTGMTVFLGYLPANSWKHEIPLLVKESAELVATIDISSNKYCYDLICLLRRLEAVLTGIFSKDKEVEKFFPEVRDEYLETFLNMFAAYFETLLGLHSDIHRILLGALWGISCSSSVCVSNSLLSHGVLSYQRNAVEKMDNAVDTIDAVIATASNVLRFEDIHDKLDDTCARNLKGILVSALSVCAKEGGDSSECLSSVAKLLHEVLEKCSTESANKFYDANLLEWMFTALSKQDETDMDTLCTVFHVGCLIMMADAVRESVSQVKMLAETTSHILLKHLKDSHKDLFRLGVTFIRNLACIPTRDVENSPSFLVACSEVPVLLEQVMALHWKDEIILEQSRCTLYNLAISNASDFQTLLTMYHQVREQGNSSQVEPRGNEDSTLRPADATIDVGSDTIPEWEASAKSSWGKFVRQWLQNNGWYKVSLFASFILIVVLAVLVATR
eukprot:gb/GECG01000366.1/.p1 GENE.gb/GECG01000366.1/~~gb/GECG01000366.1/.p1  ORF type:complete len:940 (+),score=116.02 gb/GECG01000366.1/:1-2820(+)